MIALMITLIGIGFTSKLNVILGSRADEMAARGISTNSQIMGLACALGATLIASFAYVIVRKIKGLHHSVILFNLAWVGLTEMSIITASMKGFSLPLTGIAPWLLCLIGVVSFYGQLLLTKALQAEEAGLVSMTRTSSEAVFAFIFQIIFFREMPDSWSYLGAALVMSTVILTSTRKWVLGLPKEDKWRSYLWILTK